jgi:chromosome segregation ATPase
MHDCTIMGRVCCSANQELERQAMEAAHQRQVAALQDESAAKHRAHMATAAQLSDVKAEAQQLRLERDRLQGQVAELTEKVQAQVCEGWGFRSG